MAQRKTTRTGATVSVGRLGAETMEVKVSGRATVAKVLEAAGFDYEDERIMVNGKPGNLKTPVKSKDLVLILTPKQAGA